MSPALRTARTLLAALLLSGCATDHFQRKRTPENFVADGLSGTATAVGMVALAPVVLAYVVAEAIHTEPCPCAPPPCREASPPPDCGEPCLPPTYVPRWEERVR